MSAARSPWLARAVHAALLLACLVTLLPFVYLVIGSLKTNEDFLRSVFLPVDEQGRVSLSNLTFSNYRRLFDGSQSDFVRPLLNSVFLSSVSAVLATLFAAAGGYALARFEFRGRSLCTALVLAAILIPGPLTLAPGYQLLFDLGLLNTYAGLILPGLAPAFGVFLFRQAVMSGVPKELLEAARIDGSGELGIFFRVVLPLVKPMIGTFLMITFLGVWNNFIGPQVILQDLEKFPLTVAMNELKRGYYSEYGLQMAGTLVSIVPVMLLFMVLQREFISGLTSGAVKG